MTKFTLTKGNDKYLITIEGEEGTVQRIVDGKPSTSTERLRAIEANDRVGVLLRRGYRATKSVR